MPSLLSLAAVGVGGLALYRAYEAEQLGVPLGAAFATSNLFRPLGTIKSELLANVQATQPGAFKLGNFGPLATKLFANVGPKLINTTSGAALVVKQPGASEIILTR